MWVYIAAFSFKAADKVPVFKKGFFVKDFYEINAISVGLSETGTLNNSESLRLVYASLYCGRGGWAWKM